MASRGAVLTPLPNRSTNREPSTIPHPPARANNGRLSVDTLYPKTMRGLRFPSLSLSQPAPILSRLAVVSAMPSMRPMSDLLTPSTEDRNTGTSE